MDKIDFMSIKYKNYEIVYNLYKINEYSVQYCGDDFLFESEKEAEMFIDSIMQES